MKVRRIVFWHNFPSMHLAPFVRALAERLPGGLDCAIEQDFPATRANLGWVAADYGQARIVDVRTVQERERLLSLDSAGTLHLFGGFFSLPVARNALQEVLRRNGNAALVAESVVSLGWRGPLRSFRAWWEIQRIGTDAFGWVFAMGATGAKFYRRLGIPSELVHEFAYCVESSGQTPATILSANPTDSYVFAYVGALSSRKGVDRLLGALAMLGRDDWILRVIGDGGERAKLERLATAVGIRDRVVFEGSRDNRDVRLSLASVDCVVLPSRWDGWGAVVNEAVHAGAPVVCSDRCGAAALLADSVCGTVFHYGKLANLTQALVSRLNRGKVAGEERATLRQWATDHLSGDQLARYFLDVVDGRSVEPPWRGSAGFPLAETDRA